MKIIAITTLLGIVILTIVRIRGIKPKEWNNINCKNDEGNKENEPDDKDKDGTEMI